MFLCPRCPTVTCSPCCAVQKHLHGSICDIYYRLKHTPTHHIHTIQSYTCTCTHARTHTHTHTPVALQYTTLAFGSLSCSSTTADPVLLDLPDFDGKRFFALWHSSNTIYILQLRTTMKRMFTLVYAPTITWPVQSRIPLHQNLNPTSESTG